MVVVRLETEVSKRPDRVPIHRRGSFHPVDEPMPILAEAVDIQVDRDVLIRLGCPAAWIPGTCCAIAPIPIAKCIALMAGPHLYPVLGIGGEYDPRRLINRPPCERLVAWLHGYQCLVKITPTSVRTP